jgi:hypothetical protein
VISDNLHIIVFFIVSRIITFLHAFANVNQWRGLWKLLDIYTGLGPISAGSSLAVGLIGCLALKTFSTAVAPPAFCVIDKSDKIYDSPLRFRSKRENSVIKYALDCFFTVTVNLSLVILCWRGLWNLLDIYLFPDDSLLSSVICLGSGYSLCSVLTFVQYGFLRRKDSKSESFENNKLFRLASLEIWNMIGFVGSVGAWRGLWNFYNLYIVLETPNNETELLTAAVGAVGLVVIGCFSTIIVKLRPIDGSVNSWQEWQIASFFYVLNRIKYQVSSPVQ